jgi:1-acyl-sn-glycerol-3-phosphate acyltransferase
MQVLRTAYKIYAVLVFAPILGLSTLLFGGLALLLVALLGPSAASYACGRTWARVNGFFTPMWTTVTGRENVTPGQSYVIVSNHQSLYDIFLLYGWLEMDFRWVMKQELRKVPMIGIACERLGHIFIDRKNRAAALASIHRAKSRISGGTSVLFFPEGTRSRDGVLLPFKKGAFQLALELELPILPVTVSGTRRILPPDTVDLFPGPAFLQIHAPIEAEGHGPGAVGGLLDRARSVVASGLDGDGAPPAGDPAA